MADPTEDELEQLLKTNFTAWLAQIKRLIKTGGDTAAHAANTLKLNGYSWSALLKVITDAVAAHVKATNPHNTNASQITDVMSTGVYANQARNYHYKDMIPLSKIPMMAVGVSGNRVSLPATTVVLWGRKVTVPAMTVTLANVGRQFIKLAPNPTYAADNNRVDYAPTWIVETSDVEFTDVTNLNTVKFMAGVAVLSGGVYTVTMERTVYLRNHVVTTVPRGNAVPASTGTQAQPGSINAGWIN